MSQKKEEHDLAAPSQIAADSQDYVFSRLSSDLAITNTRPTYTRYKMLSCCTCNVQATSSARVSLTVHAGVKSIGYSALHT